MFGDSRVWDIRFGGFRVWVSECGVLDSVCLFFVRVCGLRV